MVGDASYGTIYQAEDVVIEMGLVYDQFLNNLWTIRAEQELCFLQRNADLGAFVKVTDITAAIAALGTVKHEEKNEKSIYSFVRLAGSLLSECTGDIFYELH